MILRVSDSCFSKIFLVRQHSAHPSVQADEFLEFLLGVTANEEPAGDKSKPECLKHYQNASAKIISGSLADNGLPWSTSLNKVNNPFAKTWARQAQHFSFHVNILKKIILISACIQVEYKNL